MFIIHKVHSKMKRSKNAKSQTFNPGREIRPPVLSTNVRVTHKYRFNVGSSKTGQVITANQIFGAAGVFAVVANSTVAPIYSSFKLNFIEVWAASSTQVQSIAIEWLGNNNSPNIEITDTGMTPVYPAHVRCAPPKNSLASFWQTYGVSGNMFILTCPSGSIIDLSVQLIMADTTSAISTISVTSATVGHTYFLSLDHPTAAIAPVQLTSTT